MSFNIQFLLSSFESWSSNFIVAYGYFGVLVVSLISSASIVLPIPGFAVIIASGAFLDPFWVALISGIGFAVGDLTGVLVGKGGRKTLMAKYGEKLKYIEQKVKRHGPFLVFFIFAVTPLPDDVSGLFAGLINYDWRKFLLAALLGNTIVSFMLAYGGYFGFAWLKSLYL
ncbi:MAG: TVP38/TMEM64 family protein [Candidatus Aenigmatarchaeota archaeon]